MIGRKNVVWKNAIGQTLTFDNVRFFVEEIDMTGTSGLHTVESLAGTDGQQTVDHHLAAKTIPCSFAVKDVEDDMYMQRYIAQIFSPLGEGTLTVYTRNDKYSIACYPQSVPVFKRDQSVPCVYRFSVDFVADYPYWRKGSRIDKAVSSYSVESLNRIITSDCPFDIPPDIYFPASESTVNFQLYPLGSSSKSFTILPHDFPVRVITQGFSVINDNDGTDQSQLVNVTAELDEILIRYGKNIVVASPDNGVRLQYYELSMGEV